MAQLSGGTIAAIRMDQIDMRALIDGDPLELTAFAQRIDKGSGITVTWNGVGFRYGAPGHQFGLVDRLVDGMVFSIVQRSGDNPLLSITSLTFDINKVFAEEEARAASSTAALTRLFATDDTMQGTSFDDFLNGYGGHDNLIGSAGSDTLRGGSGNDHLYGQSAGGGADGADSIAGDDGADYLQGNAGDDTLDGGADADRIQGGQGNDILRGGAGSDVLNGNLGDDTLDGGDGADLMRGGQGNDSLTGGAGADTLSGDLGIDTMRGGTASDVFAFSGDAALIIGDATDVISDFSNNNDKIDLAFTVAAVLTADRQSTFAMALGEAQRLFDGRAGDGEVAAVAVGSSTYVFFARDGGAKVDSAVQLNSFVNVAGIDAGDFI